MRIVRVAEEQRRSCVDSSIGTIAQQDDSFIQSDSRLHEQFTRPSYIAQATASSISRGSYLVHVSIVHLNRHSGSSHSPIAACMHSRSDSVAQPAES